MMSGIVPVKDPEIKYKQIFINNEFVDSVSGKTFPTLNPATGEKIADVAEGDKADVDLAVAAARKAFALGSPWRTMDASQRGAMLYKLSGLIEKNMALLATIETMDNGKLFSNACRDIAGAVGCMRYFAGIADKLVGETIPVDGNFFCYTRHEPIGVVGQIIPWNFPAFLAVGKISPALAAGCVCIVKPAEQTPLTALVIAQLVKEAGFPPGVVNVIPGYGPTAGKAISEHMDIDKVAFTGSTEVGRIIQQASGQTNLKKVTLELGGKSPNIVFSDVDLDTAVPAAVRAVMFNQGQVCVAGTRTFVQEDIYDEFVKRSVEQAQKWQVGDPFTTSGDAAYGAQIDETQTNKIMELIESGKNQGAKLLTGGKRMEGKGYFVEPTVFTDVKDDMRIAKEEIFGPVQSIFKFKTIDEVITRANTTMYGLGAAVFTKDIEKAITIANSIQAGTVWVNCYGAGLPQAPFGGYKMSGIGREYGTYGVKEYQQVKTVVVKIGQKNS